MIPSTAASVVLSHPIPSHTLNPSRVTWFSVAAAVALSFWALAGLQAETAQYMERCQSAGRSFSDCALTASGR
jgi:hypothetical protein